MKKTRKKIKLIIALNIILIIFNFLLVLIAKKNPNFIEKYYSRNVFYHINKPLLYISNRFHFSLGEILIFIVIVFILSSCFRRVCVISFANEEMCIAVIPKEVISSE